MKKVYLITAIIVSQILFLSGMIIYHSTKLSSATRVVLKTVPYDPMSMFRGRYVNLRYEISSLPARLLKDTAAGDIKGGETLFVKLKNEGDCWIADSVYKKCPNTKGDVYIRGRLHDYWYSGHDKLDLEYGIESYFLNEESAKEVDKANLGGGNWEENQKRREENLAKLDAETRRIGKDVTEWWVKKLEEELRVWVKEEMITKETSDALISKYDKAIEKYKAANEDIAARSRDRKPVLVEVAIDKEGNGYPTKIIIGSKEYR